MVSEVFIRTGPGERRVSQTKNGILKRVLIDRVCEQSAVDGIYLGKIVEINRALNAAFVDIGLDEKGFLAAVDAQNFDRAREKPKSIERLFTEGESVIVQVIKDPQDGKGAKLTTNISVSAFNVVITPGQPGTTLSKRIGNNELKDDFEVTLKEIVPPDTGYILRTKGSYSSREVLAREAKMLLRDWEKLKTQKKIKKIPSTLFQPPSPILRFLLDSFESEFVRIRVEDRKLFLELETLFESRYPELLSALEIHEGLEEIYAVHDLIDQWEQIFSNVVKLPSGGSIIIEETSAMIAIDVNSGKSLTGMSQEDRNFVVNIEAVRETSRQMLLRNLGGQIVIDFLKQKKRDKRELIYKAFEEEISEDREHVNLVGFTRLGMFELTRRRRGKSTNQILFNLRENAKSPYTLALEILYQVKKEIAVNPGKTYFIDTSPIVAEALKSGPGLLEKKALEKEMLCSIEVRINSSITISEVSSA